MNTRLEQDALDTLEAFERQQVWRQRVIADRARTQQPVPSQVWAPVLSEQERAEREQQIQIGLLPF